MKHLYLFSILVLLLTNSIVNAQSMRISAFSHEGYIMGNFAKKEINNPSAGYIDFRTGGGIEFNYFTKKNIGFGIRWTNNYYARDVDSYESDLKEMLTISDNQYDIIQSYGVWSFGSDFGISYLADFSDKISLEPYFYFGFNVLTSPLSRVVYYQNGKTYHFEHKPNGYLGINYAPGVKMHWKFAKQVGLYVSLEYNGSVYSKDDERSLLYSSNTFIATDTEKEYMINSLNFGLGLSFCFGKDFNE